MITKISISIPKPCGENWETMTKTEKGKFCTSCQKNVIDFTHFSDREIIKEFNDNENICGRFSIDQINRNLVLPKEKNSVWSIAAASIIAFLGFSNQTAKAQESVKTEQTDTKINTDKILKIKKNKTEIITGIVTDGKFPFPVLLFL